jgi:predicted permease
VSIAQAAAEVDAIGKALEREYPGQNLGKGFRLVPATPIPGNILPVAGFLSLLMGIVSLVLVIACANVAAVLLARAAARRREIAVRLAMGAGRSRLVRQLLTETIMLFAAGGAAGLLIARGMTTLLVSLLPALPLPIDVTLPLDGRVIAFTTGLSLLSALLSGLVPALHASRADVVSTLKDDALGPSDRLRLRNAFVVGQVAISILLVVGAALFVKALQKAGSIELGFDPHGVELTSLDLGLAGYSGTAGKVFAGELVDRVRQLPGVQQATMASTGAPIGDGRRTALLTAPGVSQSNGRPFSADWNAVDPGYFGTLRIPLVAGRDFNAADRGPAPQVAILGEAAAKRFFPGKELRGAVGQSITLQPGRTLDVSPRGQIDRGRGDASWTLLVVGVARDIKYFGPRDTAPHLFVYVPLQQQPFGSRVTIVARTAGGRRIAGDIRALIAQMNPNLPIVAAQTLEDWTAVSLVPQRVAASVSGALGMVGLLLAAIGIYGVTAYTVARRTREIGIRIALGAKRADIVGMVLGQGMSLAIIGSALGLLLAAAAGRLLAAFLLGVAPIDPVTFLGATVLFTLIGLAACYVPARRAIRIDAMEALRYE